MNKKKFKSKDNNVKRSNPKKPFRNEFEKPARISAKCRDVDHLVRESANDISWYNANPQLLKDAANLSYAEALGLKTDTGSSNGAPQYRVPGICRIGVAPSFGISEDGSSVLNVAARRLYAYVRHANSGSKNYEAADLMTYVLAMSSVYAIYSELTRLYGVCRLFSGVNRYIAKGLVTAMGYDYDDIVSHLAQLRYSINNMATRVNSFAVPKQLSIFERQAFIPMNLFKDSDEDKASIYFMQYDGYFKWSPTAYDTGSALIYTDTPWARSKELVNGSTPVTYSAIAALIEDTIVALMTNEDIGIMSGDIRKAFGEENLYQMLGIGEDYAALPIYDEMVLSQIHNSHFLGCVITGTVAEATPASTIPKADVHQVGGQLIYTPYVYGDAIADSNVKEVNQILDCGFNNPTPEYNMEATRLKGTVDYNSMISINTTPGGGA